MVISMLYDVSKVIIEKSEKVRYSDKGIATVSLEEFRDVDEVKKSILEIEKLKVFTNYKFSLNEGTMMLSIYNPDEDITGFSSSHPNSRPCGK